MFDPISIGLEITAIVKGAELAVKTVQQAIKVGKDIHAISGDIMSFLSGTASLKIKKAEIEAAALEAEDGQDFTALAFDIVLKEKKLKEDEEYLKDVVIYELDQATVWFDMVRKRDELISAHAAKTLERIRAARAAKQAEESRIRRKKEEMIESIQLAATIIVGTLVTGSMVYGLYYAIKYYH
jgi:hypothetical protein